jgi:hypothetical protein
MITVLDAASDAAGRANEDASGAVGDAALGAAWVLDGATGLAERETAPGGSDAAWYAARLSEALGRLSLGAGAPAAVFRAAIEETAAGWAALPGAAGLEVEGGASGEAPAHAVPSAAGAWVRWTGGGPTEVVSIGDCRALWRPDGGRASTLAGPPPGADAWLDDAVREAQSRGLAGPDEVRAALMPLLRRVRAGMNAPGGYWILGMVPDAAEHLTQARVPPGPGHLLLATDGFYRLVDAYGALDEDGLVAASVERGLAAVLAELRAIEATDPDCRRHPRLKPRDDATAVLLRAS